MTAPTPGELAGMRTDGQRLTMVDVCAITDPGTIGTDAGGDPSISGPSTTSNIPCSLTPAGTAGNIREWGEQLVADADWQLAVPAGTTIREGWTAVVTRDTTRLAAGMPATVTVTIVHVRQPSTLGVRVRALVKEGRTVGG